MSEKIIFSLVGVNKIYPPNNQVIKDISLSFFYGAKIGVLGLNGSGKSTLLRIIAGVETEFNGERIIADGFIIGYLAQEPQLDDDQDRARDRRRGRAGGRRHPRASLTRSTCALAKR